jgi:putative transposase
MTRIARLVVPGLPHHVTQRGNRSELTFFHDGDYALYLELLAAASKKAGAEIWAYCLMPNHVHAIISPSDPDGLRRTFADLHRRYTSLINARHGWTGHLWQGRFGSVVMDEDSLLDAARYVSLNPVRARLVTRPQDWPWSSVRAHLAGVDDSVVSVAPVLSRVGDFAAYLRQPFDETRAFRALRMAETTGRPLGDRSWVAGLEARSGRRLAPLKRGPRPRQGPETRPGPMGFA